MTGHTVKARGVYKLHTASYVKKGGESSKPFGKDESIGVGRRRGLTDPGVRKIRHVPVNLAKLLGPPC
jgi:hypothetical protein